jgi:SNF2 family DNA or RNA helicase
LKPGVAGHYDAVILDEAHYIKGLDTYWTWSVQRIAKHADMVLPMTGTPMPNWAHELFTVLRVLRPEEAKRGQRLGSYWHWVERWFTTAPSRFSEFQRTIGGLRDCEYHADCKRRSPDDPCEHWLAFARENLGDQYMRHLQAEVFDLPPMVAQDIQVPLDSAARRMYAELRKDYITETESGAEVMAWNQGARNVMLDKLTTSPWLLDPQGTPRGGKLDMLRFDLESRTRPTVVFAHYQATVEACAGVAKDLGRRVAYVHGGVSPQVTRRAVRAFQAGELDVLVGSYEKMAEGVTLTQADQAIFVETSFKPSKNTQARRRIHRIGQTRPCVSRTYITPGTVDAHKQILLREKNDQTLAAMTAAEFARLL